jgi:carbonic anhydrase
MRLVALAALFPGLIVGQVQKAEGNVSCDTARACWEELRKGNERWAQDPIRLTYPNQNAARRSYVANSNQKPFAVIVACSDSRVPPELIFDRGLGDLFIIRVAGNIVDEFSLGAIQYALQQVGTKLVVVMGHEKCGAIEAALNFDASKPEPAKPLRLLVEGLVPARTWARKEWGPSVGLNDVADANVYLNMEKVKRLAEPIAGPDAVMGKRYMLDGHVVDLRPAGRKATALP